MTKKRNRAKEHSDQDGEKCVPLAKKAILAKAAALTGNAIDEATAIQAIDAREEQYTEQGAIAPDYDPESLLNFIELSPHLAPNIAAYVQNIEGYGHQKVVSEAWMGDLGSEEAFDAVKQALIIEAWVDLEEQALATNHESAALKQTLAIAKSDDEKEEAQGAIDRFEEERGSQDGLNEDEIPDDLVQLKLKEIGITIRREEFMFDAFFKNCCSVGSIEKLRRIVRQDIESHGWGCIEMERDGYKRLKRLSYIPGYTVRPLKQRGELIEVIEDDSVTPLSEGREIIVKRRFTIFVQIVQGEKVYFKTPKDPRVVSRTTGKAYKTVEDMRKPKDGDKCGEGPDAQEANDLLWISLHSPKTACPPPRWIGNLLQVLGGREADETNYFYLKNNAIPSGLLFVSGGTIQNDIKSRLENRLSTEIKGSEGSGKIIVVQAKPTGKSSADGRSQLPEIHFQSLREASQNDSLFTGYDERGSDRIGASFRLSPILRGYTPSNLNRATAIAAIMLAEQQVFQPEREDIDWLFNKYILTEIGIKYLRLVSNSPPTRSVDDMVEIIKAAAPQGGLLPYEIRTLLSDLLNRPLAKIKEDWAKNPMPMTLAGLTGDSSFEEGGEPGTELNKKLASIEARIKAVVREELDTVGMDIDVGFLDQAGVPK